MKTLNIPLGNTLPEQIATLHNIKDAAVKGLLNHPGIIETLKEHPDADTLQHIYLEADLHLQTIDRTGTVIPLSHF
jgi:hypothetical protein